MLRRYVAVGDSLTEGKGDLHPDGRPRGFADLLAGGLAAAAPGLAYANLARPSVRVHEVLAHQVPDAVASGPDLVTALAGVNDVIALAFPARAVADRLEAMLEALVGGAPGARVVTATMPDLVAVSAVARLARHRVETLNAGIRRAAARTGAELVDLEPVELSAADLALDRIHPGPSGHLRIARAFAAHLGVRVADPAWTPAPARDGLVHRAWRTAVVAPRFTAKRLARAQLIAAQPPKRPDLQPADLA